MSESTPNRQYNVAESGSLPVRIATWQRRRMFGRFLRELGADVESLLDVGVDADQTYESSNYLEAWYPEKDRITAIGLDDASALQQHYKGVTFVQGNGLCLPFADQSFDVVHASAVIEHVGSRAHQQVLIAECARVARKTVFITTPNRWFPIEFHTVLPLVHWLPPALFRKILRHLNLGFFAAEKHLNLMAASDLQLMGGQMDGFKFVVSNVRLAGWPSNLLLIGHRVSPKEG